MAWDPGDVGAGDAFPDLDPRWGTPPWRVEAAVAPSEPPARVDVAVVGAGFTGLSTGLAIAEAGARVAIFERAAVGAGASGRTGGIALEATAAGPLSGADACLDALRAQVARLGTDCALALDGCWEVRHRARAPRAGRSWPDSGAHLVVAGDVPGGCLDPGAYLAGLARAAQAAGASIHERAPVTSLAGWGSGAPPRLRVRGRIVEADRLVLAVNGFLPKLAPQTATRPALTLALATEPLAREVLESIGLGMRPFYTVDLPYLWGRASADGRLVVGAGLAFDPDGDVLRVSCARADVRQQLAQLESRVRGLHPALRGVAVTHRWGGPIAFRAGGAPLLAALSPRVLASGACAGHGVALASVVGAHAAAWALRGTPPPAWGAVTTDTPA